jgi:TRAP-type C4-dicarboxylate transport system permease small subunit
MRHFIEQVNLTLGYVAGGSMLVLAGLTANEVIRRYFFNAPTSWSLEITEYFLVLCVYFGMAYSIRRGAHVSVPLIHSRFTKRTQSILDVVSSILLLTFWIVLFWQMLVIAIDFLIRNVRSETILATPLFYPVALAVIGSFMSCLQGILIIYDNIVKLSGKGYGNAS